MTFVLSLPDEPVERISWGPGEVVDVEPGVDDGDARAIALAAPSEALPRQCRDAARSLGFAVPGATKLPSVSGARVSRGEPCGAPP